jgi:hypothetical protein
MATFINSVINNIKEIINPNEINQEVPYLVLSDIQNTIIDEEMKQDELVKQILYEQAIRQEVLIKEEETKLKNLEEMKLNPNIEFENVDTFNFVTQNTGRNYSEFFGNINDNSIKLNFKTKEIFILIILVLIIYLVFIKDSQ